MKDSIDREHQVEELATTVIRLLEAIQEMSIQKKAWRDIPSVRRKVERARAIMGLDGK